MNEAQVAARERREVVFIRHGESLWNVVFNRSKNPVFFIPRLIASAAQEISLIVSGGKDSLFLDSPLSDVGLSQAHNLHKHMLTPLSKAESEKHAFFHRLLRGEGDGPSVIVSSNLRRALSTAALVFQERLKETEQRIVLVPHLQEISRNPDALSIMPPYRVPSLSWIEAQSKDGPLLSKTYSTQVDPQFNSGNKTVDVTGRDRLQRFAAWLFSQPNSALVVGHSLWFRSFFREFLPEHSKHPAKLNKMSNGSAVGFVIEKLTMKNKAVVYRIESDSITLVYGSFK